MGDAPQPLLRVDHERTSDAHVIRLIGELDLGNVEQAKSAMTDAIQREDVPVVVELSELEFIDSVGISMLLEVQALSRRDSDRLGFRGARAEVARVIELTGVVEQLRFID